MRTILGLAALMDDTTDLEDVIKAYADSLEANGKAEKTILWYTENLLRIETWLHEQLGRKPIVGDLDVEVCEGYLAYRRRLGRAAATVRGDAMTLKAFGSWLARKRSIKGRRQDSVLAHLCGGPVKDKDTRDQEPLTDEELERLLGHFDPSTFNGLRNGCLIRLMVDCGCRQGEALSARVRDIVWPRNEIVITGKTGTRSVKFSDETAAWLDRYVRERSRWAREEVECLIVNERGQPLGENGLYSLFARMRRAVGIPRLHAHLLRHTWATNFRRFDCGDLLDLQERGGWADLGMVRRYAHIRPDSERQRERSPLDMLRAANTQPKAANYRGNSGVQQRLGKLFSKRRRRAA